ncbi:MAG TPA: ComEC/Rec2 family competence protein [Arachnia sp.]|nr:ComEC/Rec2 family competence protein [Arachnia sp.]HMT85485.1 ComEC/Rec2 family competence protein [Arachnia sp.]
MTGHDWRLVPSAVAAWVAAWLGVSGHHAVAVWLGVLCAATAVLVGSRWWQLVAVVFVAVAVVSVAAALLRHGGPLAALADEEAIVRAEVTVVSEARVFTGEGRPAFAVAAARIEWVDPGDGPVGPRVPVEVRGSGTAARWTTSLAPGGRYRIRGVLGPGRPGGPAAAALRAIEEPVQVARPGVLHAVAAAARQGLRDATASLPTDQAALVPSLVVGDTSRITAAMESQFKTTALAHLMAVSGANLTLMLGVVLALTRAVGGRGWTVRLVAAAGVGMFVLVCGPEPSVLRAAVMGLVALAATGIGKGRRTVRALALCVVVLLLIDPWLARSYGFALSVSACLGIVVLTPLWIEAMTRWSPRWLAEALAVPLAAQLATTPLIVALSSQVSVVGVLSNLLAAPFVGPTTVLGFAAAALSWWPGLAALAGWAAGWCSQPILWIAETTAGLPGAAAAWPAGWVGVLLAAAGSAACAVAVAPVLARWWCAAALVAALVLASVLPAPTPGWPMGDWRIAFCAVGQGDATVVRTAEHGAIVVDAGPEPTAVLACLDALGVRDVPLVVLTHYHADHVGGFEGVVRRYRPTLVLVSALAAPAMAAAEVNARARAVGAEARTAVPGERIVVGEVAWTTVASGASAVLLEADGGAVEGESGRENDASVVGIVETSGIRMLLPGDVEPDGQRRAMEAARSLGVSLEVEILKLPHHGSSRQDRTFFEATGARIAVASSGPGNAYGHPSDAVLRLSGELGMQVLRTDEQGSLALAVSDRTVAVRASGRQLGQARG